MSRYKLTPKIDVSRPSDAMHIVPSIAGISGDTLDLRAVSGKPNHCPLITLIGGPVTAAAVITPEDDSGNITVSVPVFATLVMCTPIRRLVKSGSGAVQVLCEWWSSSGSVEVNP